MIIPSRTALWLAIAGGVSVVHAAAPSGGTEVRVVSKSPCV